MFSGYCPHKSRYLCGKSLSRMAGRPRRHFVSDVALPSNFVPTNPLISVPTSGICTPMLDTTWKLRVSENELTEWKAMAAERGMLLSEWIRSCCNAAGPSTARRIEKIAAEMAHDAGKSIIEELEPVASVSSVREDAAVPAAGGRKPFTDPFPPEAVSDPKPGICANCEHRRSKHGGFGSACQEDNCLCSGFE